MRGYAADVRGGPHTATAGPESGAPTEGARRGVLLATLGVPFDEAAAAIAVDSAVEAGRPLIVANLTRLEPLGLSLILGYDALEEFDPEVTASVRRPAQLARSLGVEVERLRVRSPRPVEALLDLVAERSPGMLVFGPDRRRLSRRRYRTAARTVVERAGCLVWLPPAAGS
jgi:hypothetical protein